MPRVGETVFPGEEYQYQMVISGDIITSNVIQTEWVIFRNTHVWTYMNVLAVNEKKEVMNLKQRTKLRSNWECLEGEKGMGR